MTTLLDKLIETANEHYDGHLTIMKFTTNWRVEFETPGRQWEEMNPFEEWPVGKTFEEAAAAALEGHLERKEARWKRVLAQKATIPSLGHSSLI